MRIKYCDLKNFDGNIKFYVDIAKEVSPEAAMVYGFLEVVQKEKGPKFEISALQMARMFNSTVYLMNTAIKKLAEAGLVIIEKNPTTGIKQYTVVTVEDEEYGKDI